MSYRVRGIPQARILEWVAFPFSGDLPNPGVEPRSPALQVDSLPAEPQGKPKNTGVGRPKTTFGSIGKKARIETEENFPGYESPTGLSLPLKHYVHSPGADHEPVKAPQSVQS